MSGDPVPRDKVEQLAAGIRQMLELKDQQAATQAQLIRWCLKAVTERHVAPPNWSYLNMDQRHKNQEKRRQAHTKALKALAWLADKLEGKDVPDLEL